MLKKTKTEETIAFFMTFLSLVAFQLGEGPGPPLATPMILLLRYGMESKLERVISICCGTDRTITKQYVRQIVAGQTERAPIAVNRLGCTTSSER